MEKIIINGIEINLIRKNVKNLNLTIYPPRGEVRLSVPYGTRDEVIKRFIVSKSPWIKKHQKRLINKEEVKAREYITGELYYFLGKEYRLNIIYIEKYPSKIEKNSNGYINMYVKKDMSRTKRGRLLKEWYRKELKKLIPPLITKWEKRMKVKVREFGVKHMRTRWGTCNIREKRIWINLELVKKSIDCIEYIVVHEMVHLLEKDHNEKFKAYMDQFLPNWRSIEAKLNN